MPARSTRPRVFLGLTEVAGYYRNLERGFRELGVDAHFFDLSGNPFRYGHRLDASRPRANLVRRLLRRLARRAFKVAARPALLVWVLLRYDVVIFNGFDSFFWFRDLPLLRALGKKVLYVFNGSDHRPPYLNGKWVRRASSHGSGWLARETRRTKDRVRRVERSAHHIVALSSSAQFHSRPFVHFLQVGIPTHSGSSPTRSSVVGHDQLVVLHSPSDRASKGSDHIHEFVEALRREGRNVEYIELVGQPNSVVLAALERADFVVDEMYSDSPMAGFATEAALAAKPAVVGGLYAASVGIEVPRDVIPPTLFVLPEDVPSAIRRMADDEGLRNDIGQRARQFVSKRWAAAAVAERLIAVIDGTAPAEWVCEPKDLRYFGGWGLTEEMVRRSIRSMIQEGGVAALQLDDNPQLLARILEFCR